MQTRFALHRWALLPLASVISLALCATLPIDGISDWVMGLPGLVFFLVNILEMVLAYRMRKSLRELQRDAGDGP